MTQEPLGTPQNPEPTDAAVHGIHKDAVDGSFAQSEVHTVVGLLAYAELAAQMRLAIDASRAPKAEYRFAQVELSGASFLRMKKLVDLLDEHGVDGSAQVQAFNNAFDDYEQRTKADTWHERVLKGYVGHAVSVDFCRIVMQVLPQDLVTTIDQLLEQSTEAEVAAQILTESTAEDSVLASRLALWGRRLVGEALNQIQVLVAQYPDLSRIVQRVAKAQGVELESESKEDTAKLVTSWVFSQLTANHARRMDAIGLAS